MATIELSSTPNMLGLYLRAATVKKPGKVQGNKLPPISASLKQVSANPKKLAQYRKVCGFPLAGSLPATYPHILAFPLHLKMMLSPLFPFPVMGQVHIRNDITQYRAIGNQETMNIECELAGLKEVAKGLEFNFISRAYVDGHLVWEGLSVYLFRTKTSVEEPKGDKKADSFSAEHLTYWDVPANIGRCYAKVSGDSNPIHMHPVSAKLFGFPSAIAHGMWTKARCIAALDSDLPKGPFKVSIQFKLPILLPATVQFQYDVSGEGVEFRVKDRNGEKPHLAGAIKAL